MQRALKLIIFTAIYLFFSNINHVFGQSKKMLIKQAEYAFYEEDFGYVLELYNQLERENPGTTEHLYKKYIAQHMTTHRGKDMSELLAMEDTMGEIDKYFNYWIGRIHMLRYELRPAKERLTAFQETKAYKSKDITDEVNFLLDWIRDVEHYHNNPDEYEIEPLPAGINTPQNELSPAFFSDHNELIFASNRSGGDQYKIYHAIAQDGKWTTPDPIGVLGNFDYENAKVEIIDRDKRLYVFKPDNGGDLFYSHFENENWTSLVEFDSKIRNKQLESHFFINDDENLILFVSGSESNKDIWETRLVDGDWTNPQPIKGKVNSPFDEESPFVSHSGTTLYFSSNREESMGGFDVFKSEYDYVTQSWGEPKNMGFPINTLDDDINFEVTPSDQSGFLASNRLHTQGGFDIYYFQKEEKISILGQITNSKNGEPIRGVEILFHPTRYTDEAFRGLTDKNGDYTTQIFNNDTYAVEIWINEQLVKTLEYKSYIPTSSPYLQLDISVDYITPELVSKNYSQLYKGAYEDTNVELGRLGNKFRPGHKAVLNNIYFDYASYKIQDSAQPVLEEIYTMMYKHPQLKIEIAGHTDSQGPDDLNLELSKKRAEAVKKQLVKMGINKNRIISEGYGESKPLASNDDEINGREINRRIEIIVID